MEQSSLETTRNFGIFAHIDAGKTSLTERILYLAGRIRSPGGVDEGTTVTDYLDVERERGITVKAACVRFGWKGRTINLIDTPGHVDFGAEVERSLRVLDGGVVALCAVAGVQSRTETILKNCAKRGLPLVCFVNKMDRRGASFENALAEFSALVPGAAALALPWGEGPEFRGIVDLVAMEARECPLASAKAGTAGSAASEALPNSAAAAALPIPTELAGAAAAARERLVEALADSGAEGSESILAAFAEGRDIPRAALETAIRSACVAGRLVPVLCGSAFSDGSISFLLDAVAAWLPSPADASCPEGLDPKERPLRRSPSLDEPFSSLVFKTQPDEHFGRLSWLRIWSGRLEPGDKIVEAGSGAFLRAQKIFAIEADSLEELPSAGAGEIVALAASPSGSAKSDGRAGRRQPASTGSSLCDPASPILYEAIEFSEPVVSLALEPLARADGEALSRGVALLLEDDPSLRAREDRETGRVVLSGMGELHLEVAVERLRSEQGVRLRAGAPQVSCREALRKAAEAAVDFDRDMNGERVRAKLALRLAPGPRGSGPRIAAAEGLRFSEEVLAAVRRGVEASVSVGPSSSWPVEDYEATLLAFAAQTSRQACLALEIAASMAARDCLAAAGSIVLEPWMQVEIELPEDCLGPALAALSGRGGRVESIAGISGAAGEDKLVTGAAALSSLFGFTSELRSATGGRASWQGKFSAYEPEHSKKS